jgi:HlyD family secretion protein
MTVEVKVDETDIPNVKLGQTADVLIDAYVNQTFKGHVTEIGESAVGRDTGTTTGSTTTSADEAKDFKVVVTIDNPPVGLRQGLSATAKITTATRQNTVTVPIQAVTVRMRRELEEKDDAAKASSESDITVSTKDKEKGREELQGLFVIRNGRATFIQVESGIMGATDIEILKGVQPGDTIVTGSFSVLRTLKNNTKVRIDNTPVTTVAQGST